MNGFQSMAFGKCAPRPDMLDCRAAAAQASTTGGGPAWIRAKTRNRRVGYGESSRRVEVVVQRGRYDRRRRDAAQPIRRADRRDRPLRSGRSATAAPQARETQSEPPSDRPVSPPVAEAAAHALAASSPDLATLRSNLERFEGCALKRTATQLVFADGAPGSRVMFVGEAPGGDEDRIGRPFVGRAGQLLDRMLHAIGLDRQQVYIANVVPWRPPGNRTPTPQETQACLPFIRRQIELAAPEILVCLGGSATQTLLGVREGITRARGNWFAYECDRRTGDPRVRDVPPRLPPAAARTEAASLGRHARARARAQELKTLQIAPGGSFARARERIGPSKTAIVIIFRRGFVGRLRPDDQGQ